MRNGKNIGVMPIIATAGHAAQACWDTAPARSGRKKARISCASSSGTSHAAKCPPRGALAAQATLTPLGVAVCIWFELYPMSKQGFAMVNICYGVVIGSVVTPFITLAAMAEQRIAGRKDVTGNSPFQYRALPDLGPNST